ncbi:SAVED domain-containing protein [Nonomuraea angiospora]|uniref:SAVED domain-containing protein n=1 Tax=Nonomuraea angiospora TaxID=46172 RepID=UPI0029A8DB49|nr:SAVED domain-containing protein [Nonomuraea angiospora]MDX3106895.1 SAVED domain-containing protein [Nonomuraea angiospora]
MNLPQPAAGPASRSGVRRFGDHYQDLIGWIAALRVLHPSNDFKVLELEVNGVGNIDDVVLRSASGRHHYAQVKWTTNPTNAIDNTYLTKQPAQKGKSLLQKFFNSWKKLALAGEPPAMELVTNRVLDPSDPLLGLMDGRTDLLNPAARLATPGSAASTRLDEWAEHLGCSRGEVLDMLDMLLFKPGLSVNGERDRAQSLMLANGLLADSDALARGVGIVTDWVLEGRREITIDDITMEVERMRLRSDDPRAVLLIQAINRDQNPGDATVALDWVDLYEGDSPSARRQPRDPASWTVMSNDIDDAVARLRARGLHNVVIRGAMRQATFFTVGARLAQVTGINVAYVQHGTPWASDSPRVAVPEPQRSLMSLDAGNDLAVAVGMTIDPTPAVTSFAEATNLPARSLLILMPVEGAHDQSVGGPGQAVAYAQSLRNAVRAQLESTPAERVHLFLAGPGGLALLLGHRWNRVAPTTVYEDLGPGCGYVATFNVDA